MWSNTKLLIIFSFLVVVAGFSFLWFGLKADNVENNPSPIPTHFVESTPIPSTTSSVSLGVEGEKVLVTKVVDGDTIVVDDKYTVRLIGIDTPETVDPKRPVGCFGKQASDETKGLLSGKQIILQKDVSETDKYKRLLRYIFLPLENGNILFINDYLVREGFAKVLTYPPDVKYNEQFRNAEKEAREAKKGLWERC